MSASDNADAMVEAAMTVLANTPYRTSDGRIIDDGSSWPLDRADWPGVGDEVLYRNGATGGWQAATVLEVAAHDGDLKLDTGRGLSLAALDAKHGNGLNCWLLYGERS